MAFKKQNGQAHLHFPLQLTGQLKYHTDVNSNYNESY